jgi:HlyD family secretion protein
MADPHSGKSRKNRLKTWIAIAVAVLIAALLLRYFTRSVLPVRMATVVRGELRNTLSTNGIVEPVQNFAAYSPKPGIVKEIYVHEGERVKKGQLLLAMDDSQAKSEVAAAVAALRGAQAELQALQHGSRPDQITLSGDIGKTTAARDQAQSNLSTLEALQKQGAASASEVEAARRNLAADNAALQTLNQRRTHNYAPIDLEHAQANVANAQAAHSSASSVLQQEIVRAPFDGTVYDVEVRPSDFVPDGKKLVQMANLKRIQIRAYFDEPEIGKLVNGESVSIVWQAKPGRVWHGHIERTPTTITTYTTRNVGEALVSVDDSDETLLPNTNVTLTVTLLDIHDTLKVPREALHANDGGDYVLRVEGGHLHRTSVKIGALNLTEVQVLSGVSQGEVVALSAPDGTNLHSGMAVSRAE